MGAVRNLMGAVLVAAGLGGAMPAVAGNPQLAVLYGKYEGFALYCAIDAEVVERFHDFVIRSLEERATDGAEQKALLVLYGYAIGRAATEGPGDDTIAVCSSIKRRLLAQLSPPAAADPAAEAP